MLEIILATSLLLSIIMIHRLYTVMSQLKDEVLSLKDEIEKTKNQTEQLISIDVGDRAIIPDYGLMHTDTKEPFYVTYEVEIVEVSIDKVKVKVINFTSNDKFGKDPKHKNAIMNYMIDKWIPKKEIELIVDDSMRRDKKLNQLGIT